MTKLSVNILQCTEIQFKKNTLYDCAIISDLSPGHWYHNPEKCIY
jgi:hypothetical protein